jgi:crotonobetainyl-CoA:carnitine CoA-transferase CaiB-like acyl-CoA transferase
MIGWMFAGLGIGFGLTTAGAVALAESPEGEEGRVTSSMLLGDLVGASVGVGIGGVLLALGDGREWSSPDSVTVAMVPALVFLAISAVAAVRLAGRP